MPVRTVTNKLEERKCIALPPSPKSWVCRITPLNHTYAVIQRYQEQAYAYNAVKPLNSREVAKRRSSARIVAEWPTGTATRTRSKSRPSTLWSASIVERSLPPTETRIVSSAAVPATSIPESTDKEFHTRLMRYRLAISLIDSMAARGIISSEEATISHTKAAEIHGLSLCSIFL